MTFLRKLRVLFGTALFGITFGCVLGGLFVYLFVCREFHGKVGDLGRLENSIRNFDLTQAGSVAGAGVGLCGGILFGLESVRTKKSKIVNP